MSTETSLEAAPRTKPGIGRSGLILPGILVLLGIYLGVGIITMEVPDGAKQPGPTFVPILITIAIFVLAALLAMQLIRTPEPVPADPQGYRSYSDWKTVSLVAAGFLAFALLLVPAGWLISASLLFWTVAFALGSKNRARDLGIAVVFSSAIQLAFGAALGLNLPSGILEGLIG
ncbi:tripartite tricarboxylate transporter TctB family protein [Glutamicibacter sp. JL.03c]|uniref:tripartite tricarboxylate transporter TctB family protein n=1 Tax=Glutamicibacter sp. JL.03c TaxID=2984842 RepID=UPI0021F7A192|nr:tripartite tricarboxylate transporter TctB family protein [Glutamicibacter sp. JL.03c]UYQ77793.1 tripartite tricarboxylate transporter TctB family protein [Glutamicibacter sp. JL.03c]